MGKANNALLWEKFRPLATAPEPDEPEYEPPLTEAEFEAGYSDWHWNRIDAEVDRFAAESKLRTR